MTRWVCLVWALGCPRPEAPSSTAPTLPGEDDISTGADTRAPEPAEIVPTGHVEDGVFSDHELGFSVDIPQRWTAEPGPIGGNLRIALTEVGTGMRVEIWAFGGIELEPRSREDCEWGFKDSGGYRVLHMPDPITVATCVPHKPEDPRVFGYLVVREAWTWQLEIHVPSTAPLELTAL